MQASAGLESVLEKLSRSLAGRFGIRLICQGEECRTDGKTIYLPSLPDELPEELSRALHGWVDHEVGHIFGRSDMSLAGEFKRAHGPAAFSILNILEDLRVERAMRERYPGSGYNLSRCYEFAVSQAAGSSLPFLKQLAFALGSRLRREPDLPFVRPEVYGLAEQAQPLAIQAEQCANTRQTAALALQVWELVKSFLAARPAGASGGKDGKGQTGAKAAIGKRDGKADDEDKAAAGQNGAISRNNQNAGSGNKDGKQDGGKQDNGKSYSQSVNSEGGNQNAGQKEAGQAAAGERRLDSGDNSADPGQSRGDDHAVSGNAAASDDYADLTGGVPLSGIIGEVGKALAGRLGSYAETHTCYRVWTTKRDQTTLVRDQSRETHAERLARVLPGVLGARRRLLLSLQAEPRTRWLGDLEEGRVNPRALHRLASPAAAGGGTPKVFRRLERTRRLHTACVLLLDESASMKTNGRWRLAADAALALGEALSRLGVPASVIGFSSGSDDLNLQEACQATGLTRCEVNARYRTIPLRHRIYKRFAEPFRQTSGRLEAFSPSGLTPLGESMLFAARELAARPEERKALLVLTDGQPQVGSLPDAASFAHARQAIKRIEAAGIDVTLLGVKDDSASRLHYRAAVVNNLQDLPQAAMRGLREALSASRKRHALNH